MCARLDGFGTCRYAEGEFFAVYCAQNGNAFGHIGLNLLTHILNVIAGCTLHYDGYKLKRADCNGVIDDVLNLARSEGRFKLFNLLFLLLELGGELGCLFGNREGVARFEGSRSGLGKGYILFD